MQNHMMHMRQPSDGGVRHGRSSMPAVSPAPFHKGEEFLGEFHNRVQHSTSYSAPFSSWGLQLSPVVILKLMSADWMRKPATIASAQSIYLYSHETRFHCSQTFRLPSPGSLLCCSSHARNPSCRHSESHDIVHLCSPLYSSLSPAVMQCWHLWLTCW